VFPAAALAVETAVEWRPRRREAVESAPALPLQPAATHAMVLTAAAARALVKRLTTGRGQDSDVACGRPGGLGDEGCHPAGLLGRWRSNAIQQGC